MLSTFYPPVHSRTGVNEADASYLIEWSHFSEITANNLYRLRKEIALIVVEKVIQKHKEINIKKFMSYVDG